jgi:hypothetical protein
MLVKLVNKIFLLLVIFFIIAVFDAITFEYFFERIFTSDNQKIREFNHQYFVSFFPYRLYEIMIMLSFLFFLILVTFFVFKNKIVYKKHFLLIGISLNILVWSTFIISFANFYYFDDTLLRVFYLLIRAILIGWITAIFLSLLLFPIKLVDPSAQI